jgi:hypothetical protein
LLHADPALEAQLPNEINGRTLEKLSLRATASSALTPRIKALLERLGTSAESFSMAIAVDPTGTMPAQLFAIRLAGTDAEPVIQALINAQRAFAAGVTIQQATVGGKTVTTITDPSGVAGVVYAYARGDIVFGAESHDAATAEMVLRAMP